MIKILIIEDDERISKLYHRVFTLEGYEVAIAKDGDEGLMKAQSFLPSLILLDIMMPRMNGMEVLGFLKANPATQMIPVIILTNLGQERNADVAIAKGAIKYITKSDYEPKQVVEMVKTIIREMTASSTAA